MRTCFPRLSLLDWKSCQQNGGWLSCVGPRRAYACTPGGSVTAVAGGPPPLLLPLPLLLMPGLPAGPAVVVAVVVAWAACCRAFARRVSAVGQVERERGEGAGHGGGWREGGAVAVYLRPRRSAPGSPT